jgi:hypothetical protein
VKDAADWQKNQLYLNNVQTGQKFDNFGSIKGAGDRIVRMMVEVTDNGAHTSALISIEKFYRDHEELHAAIRKHRSLIPVDQQAAERKGDRAVSPESGKRRAGIMNGINKTNDLRSPVKENNGQPFLLPRSPTTFVDYDREEMDGQHMQKLTRKETEEYLKKILDNTVSITQVLEEQLKELQNRGWNEYIM